MQISNVPRAGKPRSACLRWLLLALCSSVASLAIGDDACPDRRALELYERASAPMANREELAGVIREAARIEDEPARIRACRRLAIALDALDAQERLLTRLRLDLSAWPPGRGERALESLDQQRAVLDTCPRHALFREQRLPLMRGTPELSAEVVQQGIAGWVRVAATLDARGAVIATRVADSSHPLLEADALAAVRRFVYRPPVESPSPGQEVTVQVVTDAFDIARARGCDLGQTASAEDSAQAAVSYELWLESLAEPTREVVLEVLATPKQGRRPCRPEQP